MIKKKNKHVTKLKERLEKLCATSNLAIIVFFKLPNFLSPHLMSRFLPLLVSPSISSSVFLILPTSVSRSVAALVSCLRSSISVFCHQVAFVSCFRSFTSVFCFITTFVFYAETLILISYFVTALVSHLRSLALVSCPRFPALVSYLIVASIFIFDFWFFFCHFLYSVQDLHLLKNLNNYYQKSFDLVYQQTLHFFNHFQL